MQNYINMRYFMTLESGPPHNKITLKWLESFFPRRRYGLLDFWIPFIRTHGCKHAFFDGPSMVPGEFQTANRNLIPETKSKLVEKGYVQRKTKTRQWYISWRVSHRVCEAWMRFSMPSMFQKLWNLPPFRGRNTIQYGLKRITKQKSRGKILHM